MLQLSETEKYSNWTKEQLIEKLLFYESKLQETTLNPVTTSLVINSPISTKKLDKKKQKSSDRPFDWSKYSKRHIALKIAYFGWNYHGFASQGNEGDFPTIEGHLFKSLINAKLISDPSDCNFSKCGRTDKGVSGLGQVVTLNVRSNLPKVPPVILESNDTTTITSDITNIKFNHRKVEEVSYVETLNRSLPNDIRILAWAPVDDDFDARFNCKSRKYKYFFVRGNLNVELMSEAANRFLGTHDFRNFCKIDGAKQITNFKRTILEVGIDLVRHQENSFTEFYVFNLRGTAFLWHQVRCMMAILFLIGQNLESPSIIDELLDVTKTPAKPNYEMASEIPLVLYDCEFDNLEWRYGRDSDTLYDTPLRLYNHIYEQWYTHMTKSLVYSTFLEDLDNITNLPAKRSTSIIVGGGKERKIRNYTKISNRRTCDTAESKNEKYNVKRIKLDQNRHVQE
ncbi:6179_t:CDS:1 [Funneliformis mosseae]|uniref:6179_t:CDS:1 n=1 Tax=Funneliformis mosseae TaxID=27381 RepID=A0A9N8V5I9_FUNMO|nr:6179_t:CDS:1 [Funneliformis mosseae]